MKIQGHSFHVKATVVGQNINDQPHKKDLYKAIDVGRRIILKWILKKYDWVISAGFIWLRTGKSGGLLQCNEL
jgi:hypothetical protein